MFLVVLWPLALIVFLSDPPTTENPPVEKLPFQQSTDSRLIFQVQTMPVKSVESSSPTLKKQTSLPKAIPPKKKGQIFLAG